VSGGFGPLQTGKAYRRAKHVASDFFESVLFAGWDPDGIGDGEATAFPRQQKLDTLVAQQALCFEQAEHAITEELPPPSEGQIGHRHPLPVGLPTVPGTKGLGDAIKRGIAGGNKTLRDVRVWLDQGGEGEPLLRHG
jgi:hypothetical protein